MARKTEQQRNDQQRAEQEARDSANKRRFVDQSGVVAQDLPGAEHGQNVVDPPEEVTRTLPQQHGGVMGDEGGVRASLDVSDAKRHGGRKRN